MCGCGREACRYTAVPSDKPLALTFSTSGIDTGCMFVCCVYVIISFEARQTDSLFCGQGSRESQTSSLPHRGLFLKPLWRLVGLGLFVECWCLAPKASEKKRPRQYVQEDTLAFAVGMAPSLGQPMGPSMPHRHSHQSEFLVHATERLAVVVWTHPRQPTFLSSLFALPLAQSLD